ncbi:hypothetical protein BN946_scf184762.g5 [Trametes cinnabarina]|uniref:Uncharacterized protein n=1 Tax=Pycnoporus cinnabarinus TaxID=5643 RepID=A0A060S9N3_PYCCI|nr:hypothetical protein BN946_scf184762.g5 [Trametes cinnabarina]
MTSLPTSSNTPSTTRTTLDPPWAPKLMIVAILTCMLITHILILVFLATHICLTVDVLKHALEHCDPLDPANDSINKGNTTPNNSAWDNN